MLKTSKVLCLISIFSIIFSSPARTQSEASAEIGMAVCEGLNAAEKAGNSILEEEPEPIRAGLSFLGADGPMVGLSTLSTLSLKKSPLQKEDESK